MDRCRVGFIGAGGVAQRHARHLAELGNVRVVAVTDPNTAAAESFAETTGGAAVADLDALLKTAPDAVYVCVPPFAHGDIEERVLDAGAAMFVEKPVALDFPTAERVDAAARETGVVTAVGHHWRYSPAVDLVRDLLDGQTVRLLTGSWIDKVPPVPWWAKRAMSGGQIVEQAAHVLDLIRLLCGDVVEVSAYANPAPPGTPGADIDVATVAILRLQSGAVGTVAATCCSDWKHRAGLELQADGLSITFREDCITTRTAQGTTQRSLSPDEAKRAADRAFIDAVVGSGAGRNGILVDYSEALRTHRLACAIAESAEHNRAVRLDD